MGFLDSISGGGSSMGADGKSVGGGGGMMGGLSPLGIASGVLDGGTQIAETLMKGNFDYGKANYTMADAKAFGAERGKGIGQGIASAIPIVGGMLKGPIGAIASAISSAIAAKKAAPVLENREAKMNTLAEEQMQKVRDNRFFRESDLNYGQDGSRFY